MALERAFPSSPMVNPKINITISRKRPEGFWHFAFVGTYAAKHFLDQLLADADYKWVSDSTIEMHSHGEWNIHTQNSQTGLNDIFEHEFTKAEAEWVLPTPYPNQIRQIRGESYFDIAPARAASPAAKVSAPAKQAKTEPAASQVNSGARSKKEPKPSKSGLITLPEIATPLGIDAKQARGILRTANYPKPDHGRWEFDATEAEKVKKVLSDGKK